MPGQRRVIALTSTYPRWPGDRVPGFVHDLARDIKAQGWATEIVAPHAAGARLREEIDGVAVQRFRYAPATMQTLCYGGDAVAGLRARPWRAALLPGFLMAQINAAHRRATAIEAALIHAHWLLPQGLSGLIAGRLNRLPLLVTAHGGDLFALTHPALRPLHRAVFGAAAWITVGSNAARTQAIRLGAPDTRVIVVPLGIDTRLVAAPADVAAWRERLGPGPRLVTAGRLVPPKGVAVAIAAAARLQPTHPGLTLTIAGDGPERAELEHAARAQGVAARFIGWQDRASLAGLFAAADIVLVPSRPGANGWIEGQGLVPAEAMLQGVPVIASNLGGITDTVEHGRTGWLVPPDDPDALARTVDQVLGDAERRQQVAAAGRRFVTAERSREATARRFAELYDEIAGRGR